MITVSKLISPDEAKEILAKKHPNQRPISPSIVEHYMSIISGGGWIEHPDGITITSDGVLLNGNHRLTAVVKSGVPLPFRVHYVPSESADAVFHNFDCGRARKLSQRIIGLDLSPSAKNHLATLAKFYMIVLSDRYAARDLSPLAVEEFAQIPGTEAVAQHMSRKHVCISAGKGLAFAQYHGVKPEAAELAINMYADTKNPDISQGHPMMRLRNHLVTARVSSSDQARLNSYYCAISAIHAFEDKKSVAVLKETRAFRFKLHPAWAEFAKKYAREKTA